MWESVAVPMAIRMAVPMATQRIEVITGREARRRYSDEQKLQLVEAAFAPGVSTAEFARRSGVDQSLLYRWRRQALGQQPALPAFTPVAVLPEPATPPDPTPSAGIIELEFACGARMRITGTAAAAVVSAAITALRDRPA